MQFRTINGSRYIKVFFHDSSTGTIFTKDSVLDYVNGNVQFSILGRMERFIGANEKYEFILDYEEISESIHFIQDENPLNIEEGSIVKGFKCFSGKYTQYFKGLYKSDYGSYTLLESDARSDGWRCSIGLLIPYGNNQIPGPATGPGGYSVTKVALWLKIVIHTNQRKKNRYEHIFMYLNIFILCS